MRWLASSMLLCFHFVCITTAKDYTEVYKEKVPFLTKFSEDVFIESNGKMVRINLQGGDRSAQKVFTNVKGAKTTVDAEYRLLFLYGCTYGKKKCIIPDCRIDIHNLKYTVTFEKKQQNYEVVPGSEKLQDLASMKVSAHVNKYSRNRVKPDDLGIAAEAQLLPLSEKPSPLLKELENALNESYRKFVLQ